MNYRHGWSFVPSPGPGKRYLLYVHIPFCEKPCPFCSFYRIRFEADLAGRYFGSLRKEMNLYREKGYIFDAMYIGGGTPTVMPDELEKTVALAKELWPIERISIETNPNHLDSDTLVGLKKMGVNRLSVGVQTFNDSLLKRIGRYRYGSGDSIRAGIRATQGMFDTLNVDLIFNFPSQSEQMLIYDLETVKTLHVDQVTFYPLMASDGNRDSIVEKFGRINHRQEKSYYRMIFMSLIESYDPSTAWCFSRKSGMIDEYIVDHEEYVGLGAGSLSFVEGALFANPFSVDEYISGLQSGRLPVNAGKRLSRAEQQRYEFLFKMFKGRLDLREISARHGWSFQRLLWKEWVFLKVFRGIREIKNTLMLTEKGWYYWIILMREFFSGVNNLREIGMAAFYG